MQLYEICCLVDSEKSLNRKDTIDFVGICAIHSIGSFSLPYSLFFNPKNYYKIMWTILPEIKENQGIKSKRLGYTYLHGELEEECGYDIYGFINCELPLVNEDCSYIDDSALKNGEYPCVYKDKKCTLYFWHDNINRPHGLVVYNDDKESVRYAKEMLKLKSILI